MLTASISQSMLAGSRSYVASRSLYFEYLKGVMLTTTLISQSSSKIAGSRLYAYVTSRSQKLKVSPAVAYLLLNLLRGAIVNRTYGIDKNLYV